MKSCDYYVREGDVVFHGSRFLVVMEGGKGEFLACPFVTTSEPLHRGDVPVAWLDLAEAGLPHADMRLRAVLLRRRARGASRVGVVREGVLARLRAALGTEAVTRARETPAVPVWAMPRSGARCGGTHRGAGRGSVRSMVF